MSKVIDEVVFKKSIEDMLQYLSDNCLYEFVPYDDTEISNLFSLTPEEAQKLSDLISDEVVSKYKLWSSSKVNESLISAKTECNDYTDKMLTNISSISIKYVDTLPTSDISTSTIYILKNTGGGNDTLNLYDGGSWTSIGEFTISLEDFYKKDVMDTKLNEKANKTEVLSQDKIQTTAGNETHDNVYSAKLTKTELDKKANDGDVVKKTDISTSISGTSTNDKVAGAKAVHDSLANKLDKTVILTTADEVNSFDREYQSFIIEPSVAEAVGLPKAPDSTWFCINLSHFKGFKYPSQIAFEYAGIERIMYRTAHNGVWHNWKKLCTTSVADVGKTDITSRFLNVAVNPGGGAFYSIKNGICHLQIHSITTSVASSAQKILVAGSLPAPDMDSTNGHYVVTSSDSINGLLVVAADGSAIFYGGAMTIFTSFSYPVKES